MGDLTVRVRSGPDATPLIIIKPRIAGLDTTMVVPTDRRAYYVRLESKPYEYVARVASPTRRQQQKCRNILPSNAKLNSRKRLRRSVLRSCEHSTREYVLEL